jgi:protease IV
VGRLAVVVTVAAVTVSGVAARPASAQVTLRRYVDEVTAGLALPTTPLAGDHDARAIVANPGGLQLLDGAGLTFALTGLDPAATSQAGTGLGLYGARTLGDGLLPRIGIGGGLELLRPARDSLVPEPGRPARLSLGLSTTVYGLGVGVAWRHLFGRGPAAGVDTFDLGASTRWGNRLALGAVVRDVGAPAIAGGSVQRRYEVELVTRPLASDRLELALGGRLGEADADVDGWLRASSRIVRGVTLTAQAEARTVRAVDLGPTGARDVRGREVALSAGLEVSFGVWGAGLYGSGRVDERGAGRAVGGTMIARWSALPVPAVQGHARRIERVELVGSLTTRAVTTMVLRLRAVARDPDVVAVVVTIDGVGSGWATVHELRDELGRVRAAGKPVFAYLVAASTRDYWLASVADQVYLDPAGGVRFTGLAATTMYFKGALDQLGATAQFEKIAEWKSAPEAYTEVGPTEPARAMREALYDSWWSVFTEALGRDRKLDAGAIGALVDGGPYSAGQLAREPRLVDHVVTPDELAARVAERLGGLPSVGARPIERDDRWQRPTVAVIYADGDIVDGESRTLPGLGRKLVGARSLTRALIAARYDPSVGAIVLRIDSPGGSALASEIIAREVFAARGVKPILCSMGDVAASGGYFIAAGCDVVFADAMTVTGSIGIFTGKVDLSGLLAKLGVTTTTFRRGARADMDSMFRPWTDDERAVVHDRLTYFYQRFVDTVARGRGLTAARVDQLGRGHVYTGAQALPLGLVDRLGGIGDAIELAKQRMGLAVDAPVRIASLPRQSPGLLGQVGALLGVRAADDGVLALPAVKAALAALPASLLVEPDAAQARLPFELVWE